MLEKPSISRMKASCSKFVMNARTGEVAIYTPDPEQPDIPDGWVVLRLPLPAARSEYQDRMDALREKERLKQIIDFGDRTNLMHFLKETRYGVYTAAYSNEILNKNGYTSQPSIRVEAGEVVLLDKDTHKVVASWDGEQEMWQLANLLLEHDLDISVAGNELGNWMINQAQSQSNS